MSSFIEPRMKEIVSSLQIESDFQQNYPDCTLNLFNRFNQFFDRLYRSNAPREGTSKQAERLLAILQDQPSSGK